MDLSKYLKVSPEVEEIIKENEKLQITQAVV